VIADENIKAQDLEVSLLLPNHTVAFDPFIKSQLAFTQLTLGHHMM